MVKATVYNLEGKKIQDVNLSDSVFDLKNNESLLHQVYVSQFANRRQVLAHTKDRGERAGSGRKPWKQKGTGNARVGSVRTSVWRGGGIVFGPTKNRNFSQKINKKMNRQSIKIVLSEKLRSDCVKIVENFKLKEKKTKQVAQVLKNLNISDSVLLGLFGKEREFYLYSRNIYKVKTLPVEQLNVFDMLNSKYLLLSKDAVEFLDKKYQE